MATMPPHPLGVEPFDQGDERVLQGRLREVGGPGPVLEVVGRPFCDHPALVDEGHPVAVLGLV
jgi:hypothetical protein